ASTWNLIYNWRDRFSPHDWQNHYPQCWGVPSILYRVRDNCVDFIHPQRSRSNVLNSSVNEHPRSMRCSKLSSREDVGVSHFDPLECRKDGINNSSYGDKNSEYSDKCVGVLRLCDEPPEANNRRFLWVWLVLGVGGLLRLSCGVFICQAALCDGTSQSCAMFIRGICLLIAGCILGFCGLFIFLSQSFPDVTKFQTYRFNCDVKFFELGKDLLGDRFKHFIHVGISAYVPAHSDCRPVVTASSLLPVHVIPSPAESKSSEGVSKLVHCADRGPVDLAEYIGVREFSVQEKNHFLGPIVAYC